MPDTRKTVLEMEDISISFPGVKALDSVRFRAESGASHALVGANGAGKSTLMKVLSGAWSHYTGKIRIDGVEVNIRTPRDAKDLGIEIVYQEVDTALVPYLTVAENIMLDAMVKGEKGGAFVNWPRMHQDARRVLESLNVRIDTKKIVDRLSLAEKQIVLIARALSRDCRFLILDEPTAPLSTSETEELFRVVRGLLVRGIGVIFISHRLPELKEICSEITVLRDGTFVAHLRLEDIETAGIVELMLGRRLEESFPKREIRLGNIALEVRGLKTAAGSGLRVRGVDLSVRAGEIVGLAGLVGAGKTEVCKALFGATRAACDWAKIAGKPYKPTDPRAAVAAGLALVPEERRREGIIVQESVGVNLTAAALADFTNPIGFIKAAAERRAVNGMIADLGIKTPSGEQRVGLLSGGNQQKVVVGKWLVSDAEVYIFDEPTKGVDVGAKRDIFELIGRLAEAGKAIIYASCEFAEILGITDRIYVLYDGAVVKELETRKTNEEEILFYSTGGK
jgi:simple sugar transport system ATP-binding protein